LPRTGRVGEASVEGEAQAAGRRGTRRWRVGEAGIAGEGEAVARRSGFYGTPPHAPPVHGPTKPLPPAWVALCPLRGQVRGPRPWVRRHTSLRCCRCRWAVQAYPGGTRPDLPDEVSHRVVGEGREEEEL